MSFAIFICSQKDIANMKNEIEKRQREDDNNAKANQSTQLEAAQNGTEETAETGVNSTAAKLVAC